MKKPNVTVTIAPPADPTTPAEWQTAVDAAKALLTLEAARSYGLVRGGPGVNVGRCEDLLARGRARGIEPSPDAVERYVGEWNRDRVNG